MLSYCFSDFLERMSHLDYHEILVQAGRECESVEKSSSRGKGSVLNRKKGSLEYVQKIKEFLFFMRHGIKPESISNDDFQNYLKVVKPLIEKGQLKTSILKIFT